MYGGMGLGGPKRGSFDALLRGIAGASSSDSRFYLRDDDSLLRQVFFSVLRHHHPNLANKVDVIYALSSAWVTSRSETDFELLVKYVTDLKPEERILVSALSRVATRALLGFPMLKSKATKPIVPIIQLIIYAK